MAFLTDSRIHKYSGNFQTPSFSHCLLTFPKIIKGKKANFKRDYSHYNILGTIYTQVNSSLEYIPNVLSERVLHLNA